MTLFGWNRRVARKAAEQVARGIKLGAEGFLEQSLWTFDGVARRHAHTRDPALRVHLASALYNRGITLARLAREPDAREAWQEVVQQLGADIDGAVLPWVARSLFNLATSHHRAGETDAAIGYYEDLVGRFEVDTESELFGIVCEALSNFGLLLHEQGRQQDAVRVCNALLLRLDSVKTPHHDASRIGAFGVLSGALHELGRNEEALVAIDGALEALRSYDSADRAQRNVDLLTNKGCILLALGQMAEAAIAFGAAFEMSRDRPEPEIIVCGARAMWNKALVLGEIGAVEDELAVLSTLIERFTGRPDPRLTDLVVRALVASHERLLALGRKQEAQDVQLRLERLSDWARDADDHQLAARALLNGLQDVDRAEDRIRVLDEVAKTLDVHPGAGGDEILIGRARLQQGLEHVHEHRLGAAIKAWDDALARLSARNDEAACAIVAWALLSRAKALNNLGCVREALAGFASIITRFAGFRDAEMSSVVIAARDLAAKLEHLLAARRAESALPITIEETLSSLQDGPPAAALENKPSVIPHYITYEGANGTLAKLQYAAHDRKQHEEGITGSVMVAACLEHFQQERGRRPAGIVFECAPDLGHPAVLDTNFQLLRENMAAFGLPLRTATQQTHVGQCAEQLAYRLQDAALITGSALACHFESLPDERGFVALDGAMRTADAHERVDFIRDPRCDPEQLRFLGVGLGMGASAIPNERVIEVTFSPLVKSLFSTAGDCPEYKGFDDHTLDPEEVYASVIHGSGVLHTDADVSFTIRGGRVVAVTVYGRWLASLRYVNTVAKLEEAFGRPDRASCVIADGNPIAYDHYYGATRKWVRYLAYGARLGFVTFGSDADAVHKGEYGGMSRDGHPGEPR